MPSKTSFFNKTTFRKDLTRFFPLWGLYALCLLLGLTLITNDEEKYWVANNFANLMPGMAIVNLIYALVTAAVLFGDLYNTRMCYGLHALPMNRGSWYVSHILSGLLFSLVPTAIMAVVSLPLLAGTPVTNAWHLGLYWFAVTNLQYLFFFALAVLCAQLTGNWLGLATLYGLLNFGAHIVYILVDGFFTPLLPGVYTPAAWLDRFTPVMHFSMPYVKMEKVTNRDALGLTHYSGSFTLTENWGYLLTAAALALVMLGAAYLLYRRRKLESAGDFLAVSRLAPVLAVAMALTGSVASWLFLNATGLGYSLGKPLLLLFAFAGLIVGWFAGQMLLNKSTRVFYLRSWAGLTILTAAMAAGLGLTKLDVLGIADWLPQPEEVTSVTYSISANDTLKDEDGIADMIRLHSLCLEEKLTMEQVDQQRREFFQAHPDEEYPYDYYDVYLSYYLNNGRTVRRQYYLPATNTEGMELIRHYSGTLPAIIGTLSGNREVRTPEDLMKYVTKPLDISIGNIGVAEEYLTAQTVENLFRAIIADCEAGNLAQIATFHPYQEVEGKDGRTIKVNGHSLYVRLSEQTSFSLEIFLDSENLLAWAESVGATEERLMEPYYNYYG